MRLSSLVKVKALLLKIFLSLLAIFLVSLFLDRILILFGFPSEARPNHPSNFNEIRKNVEFEFEFETNSQGLRYKEIPLIKPNQTDRVFVVGDSYTEGYGVMADQTFCALLEKEFTKHDRTVNFINGGLTGTGPLEYGRLFFSIGTKYQPDGLLICFFANDLSNTPEHTNLNNTRRSGIKRYFHFLWPRTYMLIRKLYYDFQKRTRPSDFVEEVSERAVQMGISQEQINEWKERLPRELVSAVNKGEFNGRILALGLLYPKYWEDAIDIDSKNAEAKWQSMITILSEIISGSRRQGIKAAIVFIPSVFQYDPSQYDKNIPNPSRQVGVNIRKDWLSGQTEIQKRLKLWTHREELPFLDLTHIFRNEIRKGRRLNWRLDGHWKPEGHIVAADAITKWLKENNVFSFINQ